VGSKEAERTVPTILPPPSVSLSQWRCPRRERAQISRGLLQRIEKGDPACQIGAVFEAAAIVGVTPLGSSDADIVAKIAEADQLMSLLPKHVHAIKNTVKDDF
jgi:hypothetical protein